jgi:hypothetical protein
MGTVIFLCNIRDKRKWLMLDNIRFIPFAHANLISMLQLLKRGAKVKLSSQGARSPQPIKQKGPVHYEPISWLYALIQ